MKQLIFLCVLLASLTIFLFVSNVPELNIITLLSCIVTYFSCFSLYFQLILKKRKQKQGY